MIKKHYILIFLSLFIFIYQGCALKAYRGTGGDLSVCREPPPDVFTSAGVDAQFAELKFGKVVSGGVDIRTNPQVISLATQASKDARIRDYLRCLALHRDSYSPEQVAYFDRSIDFMQTNPTTAQFLEWQEKNPFPTDRLEKAKPEVRIVSPNEGDNIFREIGITGEWQDVPENMDIWLYVYDVNKGRYFLEPVDKFNNGIWEVRRAIIGNDNDCGTIFDLGVFLADKNNSRKIQAKRNNLKSLPQEVILFNKITVFRRTSNVRTVEAEDCYLYGKDNCYTEGRWRTWALPGFSSGLCINNEYPNGHGNDAALYLNFIGSGVVIVYRQDVWYGSLVVEIDGEEVGFVNQRGSIENQAEMSFDVGDIGQHSLVLRATSSRGVITIDAIKILCN